MNVGAPGHQDVIDKPRVPHVMRGAESLRIPDDRRPVEQVARDRALKIWGELRNCDKLDSTLAVRMLSQAMLDFLGGVTGKPVVLGNRFDAPPGRPKRVKEESDGEGDD